MRMRAGAAAAKSGSGMAGVLDANMRSAEGRKMKPAPEKLDHLSIHEGADGGHIVEHHMASSDMLMAAGREAERYPFEAANGVKPKLPEGHVLQHIAEHMHIPHEVMKEPRGEKQAQADAEREGKREEAGKVDMEGEPE